MNLSSLFSFHLFVGIQVNLFFTAAPALSSCRETINLNTIVFEMLVLVYSLNLGKLTKIVHQDFIL